MAISRSIHEIRPTLDHCRSCRRLRSFDLDPKKQSQKIAAFGSSYRGRCSQFGYFIRSFS
ncbi:hypothetical protein E3W21_17545 [Pseudomonas sp. F01002]|nr:hypothetical protein E3W21_17545 [Pseudomonas sp. F01002]